MNVARGASQPLGFQSRDLNVFKGTYAIVGVGDTVANHMTRY
jgi:hypothetical protein